MNLRVSSVGKRRRIEKRNGDGKRGERKVVLAYLDLVLHLVPGLDPNLEVVVVVVVEEKEEEEVKEEVKDAAEMVLVWNCHNREGPYFFLFFRIIIVIATILIDVT